MSLSARMIRWHSFSGRASRDPKLSSRRPWRRAGGSWSAPPRGTSPDRRRSRTRRQRRPPCSRLDGSVALMAPSARASIPTSRIAPAIGRGRPAALRARRRGGRDRGRHRRPDGRAPARAARLPHAALRHRHARPGGREPPVSDSRNDFRVYGITRLIAGHHSMWEARTGRFEITTTPSTRPPTTRKRCSRTTWPRSRTSTARSPPAASRRPRPGRAPRRGGHAGHDRVRAHAPERVDLRRQ